MQLQEQRRMVNVGSQMSFTSASSPLKTSLPNVTSDLHLVNGKAVMPIIRNPLTTEHIRKKLSYLNMFGASITKTR